VADEKFHQADELGDEKTKVKMRRPRKRGERFHDNVAIGMRMMGRGSGNMGEISAEAVMRTLERGAWAQALTKLLAESHKL